MCTLIVLRRPDHPWPIIFGANRDEMLNRPWRPPARHWPDRADVVAGLDELAGGTWMGLNEAGLVACILNRHGALGPAPDKRSRGELVLEALDHADAVEAAKALSAIDPNAYRPFNLVVADNRDAWWLALTAIGQETGAGVRVEKIPAGLSMFTAGERNDPKDGRIARYLSAFEAAAAPDPDADDWAAWQQLLGARAVLRLQDLDRIGSVWILVKGAVGFPRDLATERLARRYPFRDRWPVGGEVVQHRARFGRSRDPFEGSVDSGTLVCLAHCRLLAARRRRPQST